MTDLSFSGDINFNHEEKIKNNIVKIFLLYLVLTLVILTLLNMSGVRLFNSTNLTMTLVSSGGFLPLNNLNEIIITNTQKIIL